MGVVQKKKKKAGNHLDGANVEVRKDTHIANDAVKCRGKGCLERGNLDV